MNLFDSHCHLESENFQNDLPQVMQRMAQAGVRRCVLAGSDLETSRRIVALARKHEGVYGAVGVHPHEAKTWTAARGGRGRDRPGLFLRPFSP